MTPTSKERREVAERFRATKAECESRGYPWMVEDLMQALGFKTYEDGDEGIFDRLADLIDPTCKRVSMDAAGNPPFYTGGLALNDVTGGCSVCGYPFGNSFRSIGNPLGVPNYCPWCGTRVVDE